MRLYAKSITVATTCNGMTGNSPDSGLVRYNIRGSNACRYNVQAKGAHLDDPLGRFKGNAKQYFVSPCDEEGIRYAVRVLESCYDYGR